MSAIREYKKEIASGAVVAVFGIAILAALASYYFPTTSSNQSIITCPNLTPPSSKNAPVAGWVYLLTYKSANGSINGMIIEQSCQWNNALSEQGLQGNTNTTEISINVLGLRNGYLYMDITGNNYLPMIVTDGFSNAFYVNTTSQMLVLKPGVTFSSNYETAYYKGQPITNGTSIPDS